MTISSICISLIFAVTAQSGGNLPNSVPLSNCLVTLDSEVYVPAQEAGELKELLVKEGQFVKKGDLLAQIDDDLPRLELQVAENKLKVAHVEAENNINVEYAEADANVAEAVYNKNIAANKQYAKSVPETEVERSKLDWIRGRLSIVKALMDKSIAGLQENVSKGEMNFSKKKLEHRQIISPLDGQIRKIDKRVGEWVLMGDSVLHVVRVNQLKVEGFLNISKFAPQEIKDRPVTVKVEFARGRTESFEGKITFVDPLVQAGGEYTIKATVPNREENGEWLLRAGMEAEMTIHLK
jgi:multidrug efflux pump subunit AcrA (membrane-fusion protein)